MANGPHRRIPGPKLRTDRAILITLQSLDGYSPHNPAYGTASLRQIEDALSAAEEAEIVAERALERAREQVVQMSHALHNGIQGAKVEVSAQYGEDSPAVHAIGRKQKSERRRPARRTPPEE